MSVGEILFKITNIASFALTNESRSCFGGGRGTSKNVGRRVGRERDGGMGGGFELETPHVTLRSTGTKILCLKGVL